MRTKEHHHQFVVIGGGLAGVCAAVTAARMGIKTALVQDRSVLGGNASSEIRVPPVGATQCNFAYSRETGLIEELFLNNLKRNPTWNIEGWNLELESLVRNESNLELFLNAAVCDIIAGTDTPDIHGLPRQTITAVRAYCSPSETWHIFHASCFADCSGDGIVGSLSGADFRYGVEARSEFGEPLCPEKPAMETMGLSLQMRARDAGRPVPFVKPAWVRHTFQTEDFGPYRPVNEHFFPDTGGFWWLEWGGALDTVHDTMYIKDEVQCITLGVWDYLKNRSPLAERLVNYELDWMGAIPGKRESRRFEGDHILTMGDIDSQAYFEDAVAFGGWGFDHHPPGGFHDKINPSTHQYLRGPHNVPLRCLYSRNISNLFFAGRNISATHFAMSSTRVMLTCAQLGEAVGVAAAHAVRLNSPLRMLTETRNIQRIQEDLIRHDHHIHAWPAIIPEDIAAEAKVTASSTYVFKPASDSWGTEPLTGPRMQLLAISGDQIDAVRVYVEVSANTILHYHFHQGPENASTCPAEHLMSGVIDLRAGTGQLIRLPIHCKIRRPGWHFLIFDENPNVRLHVKEAPPGQLRYYPRPEDPIRPNPFSTWTLRSLPIGQQRATDADGAAVLAPQWNEEALRRRDESPFLGFSYACEVLPAQPLYDPQHVTNAAARPTNLPNLWVSADTDFNNPETLTLTWEHPKNIAAIQILFDSSLHFHFSQSWQGYAATAIPSVVKDYRVIAVFPDGTETLIAEARDNHRRNVRHEAKHDSVCALRLECRSTHGLGRAQVYGFRVFEA